MQGRARLPLPAGLAAALLPLAAAAVLDTAPYAAATLTYDDNVLRFADEAEALAQRGSATMADSALVLDAGSKLVYQEGLQRLRAEALLQHYDYKAFDELDRSEFALGGLYDWRIGLPWSGTLGYRQTRRLESPTSHDSAQVGFENRRQVDGSATYALTPRWDLEATLAGERKRLTRFGARNGNLDETRSGLAVRYTGTPVGNASVAFAYRRGTFPDRTFSTTSGLATAYTQYDYGLRGTYAPGNASAVRGQLGYTRRATDVPGLRDFSGLTGALAYERHWSGITELRLALLRELQQVEEADANFVARTGGELRLGYRVSPVMHAELQGGAYRDDFEGSPALAAGGAAREDRVYDWQIGLRHEPQHWLELHPSIRSERRSSNRATRAYDDTVVAFTVTVRYE